MNSSGTFWTIRWVLRMRTANKKCIRLTLSQPKFKGFFFFSKTKSDFLRQYDNCWNTDSPLDNKIETTAHAIDRSLEGCVIDVCFFLCERNSVDYLVKGKSIIGKYRSILLTKQNAKIRKNIPGLQSKIIFHQNSTNHLTMRRLRDFHYEV